MEDAGSWDTEAAGADQKWDDGYPVSSTSPKIKEYKGGHGNSQDPLSSSWLNRTYFTGVWVIIYLLHVYLGSQHNALYIEGFSPCLW